MNHCLNGVVIAAVLSVVTPVWAQPPMTPSSPLNTPPSDAAATPQTPAAARAMAPNQPQVPHRQVQRKRRAPTGVAGDHVANQLNRNELSQLRGAPAMPPARVSAPPGYPPPAWGYAPPPAPWSYPPPWGYPPPPYGYPPPPPPYPRLY